MSAAANPKTSTTDFPPEFLNEIERTVMSRSGRAKGNEITFRCPNPSDHQNGDKNPSASYNTEKHTWTCYVCGQGGGALNLADRLGIDKPERRKGPTLLPPRKKEIVRYDYLGADRALLFQVVRYDPKGFAQRRPNGRGGWEWNLRGIEPVLYRLPDLLNGNPDEWVLYPEGEKDVDRLHEIDWTATTNPMGAGKWRPQYGESLRGLSVALIPDADPPGVSHMRDVARSLNGVAREIKILRLRGYKDISEWIDAGGNSEEIDKVLSGQQVRGLECITVEDLEAWTKEIANTTTTHAEAKSTPSDTTNTPTRPTIDAGDQDLARVSAQAWAALEDANWPPRLFRFGGVPVRVEGNEDDAVPVAQTLTEDRMSHELARSAEWFKITQRGDEKPASPPTRVIKDMLAAPTYPLPPLISIVQTPVFAPDGSLQLEPGYHKAAKSFYSPAPGFSVPPIPDMPNEEEIKRANALIIDDLLGEFPFISKAERANAVALFLDPYIRNLIDGPTPLRLIEAPTPGSGKGLLADVVLRPAVGRRINVMPAANDDDEWRKRVTAQLSQLPAAILIDNLTTALDSGALSSALTTTWWNDRRLGAHEMIRVPIRCVWLATANNPTMSTELARRTVRIRLDPKVDRPWQRTGFRHEDLRSWADEHRSQLVWSALTIVRSWIVSGQPLGRARLGSFERWAAVQDGILANVGIEGFLSNLEEFYEASDLEGNIWRQFIDLWFDQFNESEVGVADLFGIAQNVEGFDFGKGSERSQKTSFGMALNQQRDRVIGDCRVVQTRIVQRAKKWRLIKGRLGGNPFEVFHSNGQDEEATHTAGADQWTM